MGIDMEFQGNGMTDDEMHIVADLMKSVQQVLDQHCGGMNAAYPLCALANVMGILITSVYDSEEYHDEVVNVMSVLQGHIKNVSN